jgi:hypothetical protein
MREADDLEAMTDPDMPQARPRVIVGAAGAIEAAFLHEVAAIRATDPLAPVDVLVGGVLLRPYLQRLIAETSPGMINVRFHTLGELGVRLGVIEGQRTLSPTDAEGAEAGPVDRAGQALDEVLRFPIRPTRSSDSRRCLMSSRSACSARCWARPTPWPSSFWKIQGRNRK